MGQSFMAWSLATRAPKTANRWAETTDSDCHIATDKEIARHALSVLDWDARIPRNAVQVIVHDCGVILTGEVQCESRGRQRKIISGNFRA